MVNQMDGRRKMLVFCSASNVIDRKYNQAARETIRAACSLGYSIVSGGTVKGTMGAVADEVVRCDWKHIGVLPRFMADVEYPSIDKTIWTDTMSVRKEKMREGTCAAVALPGGIGTLEELVETLTLAKLDKYHGKVIAFNMDGFYEPLKALLDHYVATGMMDVHSRGLIAFPGTVGELVDMLR